MAEAVTAVACPACGKRYKWEPRLMRRLVRCACGQTMRMPATAAQAPELVPAESSLAAPARGPGADPAAAIPRRDAAPASAAGVVPNETYELAGIPELPAAAPRVFAEKVRCPNCGSKMAGDAVLCLNCGYNLQTGQKLTTEKAVAIVPGPADLPAVAGGSPVAHALETRADDQTTPFKDFHLPLILAGVGVLISFIQHVVADGGKAGVIAMGIEVGMTVVITIPLFLFALVMAARVLGVSYGSLGQALIKLLAISFGPDAIGLLLKLALVKIGLGEIFGGFIAGLATLCLYFGLISWFFDLDWQETVGTVIAVWVTNFLVTVVVVIVLAVMLL